MSTFSQPSNPVSEPQSNTHLQVLNQEEGNDLLTETHMTNFQFTIALMVFLIAYALFEVPSNYMLKRLKPSNWIAFLMLSWGAITMGLGGVQNFGAVTAVRFLLGVFEAGLFPGLVCEFCWHGRG
jgi:MFS family permease